MTRYALYYLPPPSAPWAKFCAAWLGWDVIKGQPLPPPALPDLPAPVADITETPRKYGLHATLKPPFHLLQGQTEAALIAACAQLAQTLAPVALDGLAVTRLGRFLALCPTGDTQQLSALAAACVQSVDRFRAPPAPAELAKRRASRLSPAQEANLLRWGYPYVMDQFRFHLTLTGKRPAAQAAALSALLDHHLAGQLPSPFVISDIALVAERADGRFCLRQRFALSG